MNDNLAKRVRGKTGSSFGSVIGCGDTVDDLYQRHHCCRVEEMHPDNGAGTAGCLADAGDRDRGCVGGKDGCWIGDNFIESTEQLGLDRFVLDYCFDD